MELEEKKISDQDQDQQLSFVEKAKKNYIQRYGQKISWFLAEVK